MLYQWGEIWQGVHLSTEVNPSRQTVPCWFRGGVWDPKKLHMYAV